MKTALLRSLALWGEHEDRTAPFPRPFGESMKTALLRFLALWGEHEDRTALFPRPFGERARVRGTIAQSVPRALSG